VGEFQVASGVPCAGAGSGRGLEGGAIIEGGGGRTEGDAPLGCGFDLDASARLLRGEEVELSAHGQRSARARAGFSGV
jgi:hypothetical protein